MLFSSALFTMNVLDLKSKAVGGQGQSDLCCEGNISGVVKIM